MALPPGTRLGVFQIAGLLGAGGMGEVYRARDTRLDREVALKVLPEGFAEDEHRLSRFRREAKILAALDHPNIGALYDFQEQNGVHFLVMQLVEGDTLAARIAEGPVPVQRALPWFAQIARALEVAHCRGIIHRDLKPSNVKVSRDDTVRVLDFGIAKQCSPPPAASGTGSTNPSGSDPTEISTESTVAGTLSYMSPEQISRESVDRRSDVWAFGCCLYKALTGRHPFQGENVWQTMAAILEHEPDFTELPDDVPESVRGLVQRCLEKERGRRPGSMADIAVSLESTTAGLRRFSRRLERTAVGRGVAAGPAQRRLPGFKRGVASAAAVFLVVLAAVVATKRATREGPSPAPARKPIVQPIRGVVVLPFENLSSEPEQEYFVEGMTCTLTSQLGKIKALRVIRLRYRGPDNRASEVAQEDVDAVIEGQVAKAGDSVRITAQLLDATTYEVLWADIYTEDLTNIFQLQDDVTFAIAQQLKEVVITPEDEARIARTRAVDPEAYDAYLKAEFAFKQYTPEGFRTAIEYGERAMAIDPDFADVRAGGALAYVSAFVRGLEPSDTSRPRAKAWASKALRLDEDLALAHSAAGWIALAYDWDWQGAAESFERALELNPNDAKAYVGLAWQSAVSGDYDEALELMETAIVLDRDWIQCRVALGNIHVYAQQLEQATGEFEEVLQLDRDYVEGLTSLANAYNLMDRHSDAAGYLERAVSLVGRTPALVVALARTCALSGQRREAEALLQELHEMRDEGQYVHASHFASAYAALGDSDRAFEWLEKAYDERDFAMTLLKSDVVFPELRLDARFDELLKRMQFPE